MNLEKLPSVALASTLTFFAGEPSVTERNVSRVCDSVGCAVNTVEPLERREIPFDEQFPVGSLSQGGNSSFQFDPRARLLQQHLDAKELLERKESEASGREATPNEKALNSEIEGLFYHMLENAGLHGKVLFLFKDCAYFNPVAEVGLTELATKVRGMDFFLLDVETFGSGGKALVGARFLVMKNGKFISGFSVEAAVIQSMSPEVLMVLKQAHFSDHVRVDWSKFPCLLREGDDLVDEL